jgi:hypothetical protein
MKKNFLNEDGSDTRLKTSNFWEGIDLKLMLENNTTNGRVWHSKPCKAINCDKAYTTPYRPNKPIPAAPSAMPPSVPKEPSVPVVPLTKASSKNYLYIGLGIAAIIIGATLVIKNKTI